MQDDFPDLFSVSLTSHTSVYQCTSVVGDVLSSAGDQDLFTVGNVRAIVAV